MAEAVLPSHCVAVSKLTCSHTRHRPPSQYMSVSVSRLGEFRRGGIHIEVLTSLFAVVSIVCNIEAGYPPQSFLGQA